MRTLFRIKQLWLRRGQKLAVVGANGCGKSTLLASLAGKLQPARGKVEVEPDVRIVMVEQNPLYDPEKTVLDVIYEGASSLQAAAVKKFRAASAPGAPEAELMAALDQMNNLDAWQWDERATQTVEELGLGLLKERKMSMLSGGEERRVALACALVDVDATDILILDEPTNHLSAEGCDWLQKTLHNLKGVSLVLVTHDRYFLDQVCDDILEIEGSGETFLHPGSWEAFLTRRAERYQLRTSMVNDAKVQLKRAQEWMNRGPQGRGTKNKAQQAGFYDTKEKAQAVISAEQDGAPSLGGSWMSKGTVGGRGRRTVGSSANLGNIGLTNVTVRRPDGSFILDRVSFDFVRGRKVGIVGPNGAGKSTFLRALAGELELQEGERVLGDGVKLGFLTQDAPRWPDPSQRVMAFVGELAAEVLSAEDSQFGDTKGKTREWASAQLLKSVNFAQERWQTEVGMLSGGEGRRLQLLRVLSSNPNVLLLDEPTNDLDAVTVDALERLLQPWKGSVLVVSHDRSLLDGVCDSLVVFPRDGGSDAQPQGRPQIWQGSHSELQEHEARLDAQKAQKQQSAQKEEAVAAKSTKAATRLSPEERRQTQRQYGKTERHIEEVEMKLEKARDEMEANGSDSVKVVELYAVIEELEKRQAELYEDWERLAEQLET